MTSAHCLASWLDTPAGQRLLADQSPCLTEAARRFHGDTLLWAGCHTALTDTVRGCMIRHRVFLTPDADSGTDSEDGGGRDLVVAHASLHELPFRNNALDAIVLHHALELAADPRTALREVSRTLAPGGRLVICGFNPTSMLGLRRAYARVVPDSFSSIRFLSSGRLLDWLTVLGFELQGNVKYLAYNIPFKTTQVGEDGNPTVWARVNDRLSKARIPLGSAYMLSAVKQVMAVRPNWRTNRLPGTPLAPVAYPKLSAWNRLERHR